MDGITFSILSTGWIEKDKAIDLLMYNSGTYENRTPEATWWRVPNIAILIKHPEAGNILINGGAREECWYGNDGQDANVENYMPYYAEEENRIDRQLELCGVKVDELDQVVITNMCWYNTGILPMLSGKKAGRQIYVAEKDFAYGVTETCLKNGNVGFRYQLRDFRDSKIGFHYINGNYTVAECITLIELPGNFPSSLGVVIECKEKTYIYTGEAMPTEENFRFPYTPVSDVYDSVKFQKTSACLEEMIKSKNASVIFPHDPVMFRNINPAPYVYK